MKTATLRVVSLVLLLSFSLAAMTACGDLFSTTDFPSISNLEQSLGVNGDPTGKTVRVKATNVMSDGASGFIVQEGKFNFYLPSDPSMVPGDTATFKISKVTKSGDTYNVTCTKV